MTLKIIELNSQLTPDKILEEAKGQYDSVLVLGYTPDGDVDARCSDSLARIEQIVCIMEHLKYLIFSGAIGAE